MSWASVMAHNSELHPPSASLSARRPAPKAARSLTPRAVTPQPPRRFNGPRPSSRMLSKKQLLDALPKKRAPQSLRSEAERHVRNQQQYDWLLKHSSHAIPHTELSAQRKAVLRGCFQLLDADGNGTVDAGELGMAFKSLGFSEEDTCRAFSHGDQNRDQMLTFEEFVQLFTVAWTQRDTRIAFNDAFTRDLSAVWAGRGGTTHAFSAGSDQTADGEEPVSTAFPFALVTCQSPPPQSAPARVCTFHEKHFSLKQSAMIAKAQ